MASDSAEYMRKAKRFINAKSVHNIYDIADISHLIHVAINNALDSPQMATLRNLIIKIGALFKHSPKQLRKFKNICDSKNIVCKKPRAVILIRWASFYECLKDVIKLWNVLTEFILGCEQNDGIKIIELKNVI